MPITQPTIDDFQDTTVMRVIRKVVNYLVTLIPKVNEEIASVTDNAGQRLDSVEANVEALNKELPTEIRVDYDASTGNFNIDYVKEDGDVLTSNTVVIVSGSTGEVTIVQNTSGITINGTALQSATTAQPGLMTPALVSSLNNVNDTTNDHTTMLNAQAEAITELDTRVDVLEQAGGGSSSTYTKTQLTIDNQTILRTDFKPGSYIVIGSARVRNEASSMDRTLNISSMVIYFPEFYKEEYDNDSTYNFYLEATGAILSEDDNNIPCAIKEVRFSKTFGELWVGCATIAASPYNTGTNIFNNISQTSTIATYNNCYLYTKQ